MQDRQHAERRKWAAQQILYVNPMGLAMPDSSDFMSRAQGNRLTVHSVGVVTSLTHHAFALRQKAMLFVFPTPELLIAVDCI